MYTIKQSHAHARNVLFKAYFKLTIASMGLSWTLLFDASPAISAHSHERLL